MAVCKYLLLLLSVVSLNRGDSNDAFINSDCAAALTKNGSHEHLNKYLGLVWDDVYGQHEDKGYYYSIGICVSPDPESSADCAVFQKEEVNHTTQHCIGRLDNTQITMTDDHIWLELTYTGGDHYGSHCQNEARKARLVFICDSNVPGLGHFDFVEENRDDDLCYYLFLLASRQVCGSQFTPGDIIMIILVCLFSIWVIAMTVGFLYKRFMLGAKGWQQVPLIDYYREFGNLEADGCDLVCRSRGSYAPSQYKPQPPPFGTETDEETDEEKDDNLLPM